jgi:cell division protein FtsB
MDEMDEFEGKLSEAMTLRPAPPSLKSKIMQRRWRERAERQRRRVAWWRRIAAAIVLAGAVGGGFAWRYRQRQRKGEEARQQVLTALRITNHALDVMNAQLQQNDQQEQ